MWELMRRLLGVLILIVGVVLSLTNPSGETQKKQVLFHLQQSMNDLQYDFYRETCPQAEDIIRTTVTNLYNSNSTIAPRLLRLFFHDCFIGGCDASVLLDEPSPSSSDNTTEKQAIPNETLKGFDEVELIKSRLEESCPATVSCADALVLATREALLLAGGPFYPLFTGRKDSDRSYCSNASHELPFPTDDVNTILSKFALKGFNERETVSLLGGHSIGTIDCNFISDRIHNKLAADTSMPSDFLNQLEAYCNITNTSSSNAKGQFSPQQQQPVSGVGIMYYQALYPFVSSGSGFDTHYYKSLVLGRGLLYADQQLMASQKTASMVKAYASNDDDDGSAAFRRDFARAMMKMSTLTSNSNYQGPVRINCSKLLQPTTATASGSGSA